MAPDMRNFICTLHTILLAIGFQTTKSIAAKAMKETLLYETIMREIAEMLKKSKNIPITGERVINLHRYGIHTIIDIEQMAILLTNYLETKVVIYDNHGKMLTQVEPINEYEGGKVLSLFLNKDLSLDKDKTIVEGKVKPSSSSSWIKILETAEQEKEQEDPFYALFGQTKEELLKDLNEGGACADGGGNDDDDEDDDDDDNDEDEEEVQIVNEPPAKKMKKDPMEDVNKQIKLLNEFTEAQNKKVSSIIEKTDYNKEVKEMHERIKASKNIATTIYAWLCRLETALLSNVPDCHKEIRCNTHCLKAKGLKISLPIGRKPKKNAK